MTDITYNKINDNKTVLSVSYISYTVDSKNTEQMNNNKTVLSVAYISYTVESKNT